jgi:hypothetical protein
MHPLGVQINNHVFKKVEWPRTATQQVNQHGTINSAEAVIRNPMMQQ